MRKSKTGKYQITVRLDEEEAQFIIRFAKMECRSPENAAKLFIIKQVRKIRGSDKDG